MFRGAAAKVEDSGCFDCSERKNVKQQLSGVVTLVFPIWRRHFYNACFQREGREGDVRLLCNDSCH